MLFQAFGIAFVYKFLMAGLKLGRSIRAGSPASTGAPISAEVTPEMLGVGYIIGPRIAGYCSQAAAWRTWSSSRPSALRLG